VSLWTQLRGDIVVVALDAVLLCAVLAGSQLAYWDVVNALSERFSLPAELVDIAWIAATFLVAAIFAVGIARRVVAIARRLAETVVPPPESGKLDLGNAPRRVLYAALMLALSLLVGLPLVALIQPFLPLRAAPIVLGIVLVSLVVSVWRNLTHLHGHVRAGTELIVEILARQSRESGGSAEVSLADAQAILPGFPDLRPVRLEPTSFAVGRTLAELNLRVRTGATVLAIHGEGSPSATPLPHEPLRAGDILTLTGSEEALGAAVALLHEGVHETTEDTREQTSAEAGAA
ncbi:MAG TPA: TrkA C-terminal domain-containing protein, partial [Nannocystis sp.]